MPSVVRIATTEQKIMKTDSARSTPLRARKRGREAGAGEEEAERASARRATTNSAMRAIAVQRVRRSAAAGTSGVGSEKMRPAATLWISERIRLLLGGVGAAVSPSGRLRSSRPSITLPWSSSQSSTRTSAGTPTQIATKAPW